MTSEIILLVIFAFLLKTAVIWLPALILISVFVVVKVTPVVFKNLGLIILTIITILLLTLAILLVGGII